MVDDRFPQESSVEDILASIRRLLSEDKEVLQKKAQEPKRLFESNSEEDDVLELTNDMLLEAREPVEEHVATLPLPSPSQPESEAHESLLSPPTAALSAAVLNELSRVVRGRNMTLGHRDITLESLVHEMLRPLLKAWLDEHLLTIVERIVSKEIDSLVRQNNLKK